MAEATSKAIDVNERIEIEKLQARYEQLQHESQAAKDTLTNLRAELRELATDDGYGKGTSVLVAEHQRLLDQYVYRDRLLVQEFYFSIAATGLALNLVASNLGPEIRAAVSLAMVLLNAGLWIHIGHLRIDRDLMWTEARELEDRLKMNVMRCIFEHGYAEGPNRRTLSGTKLMVRTVGTFSLFWIAAFGYFLLDIDFNSYFVPWYPHDARGA